jgi:hypothetical protein
MPEPSVDMKDYVDARDHELGERLDESARDRARIREDLTHLVRSETFQLAVDRIAYLERQVSRLYGGLVVIAALISIAGVILHYTVGP